LLDLRRPDNTTIRVGVIDLPSFYSDLDGSQGGVARGATVDVARLLKKLNDEHVKGVILDLRRNGGGSLEEAINLTGLFIRKGPVVQTRGPRGDIEVGTDKDASVAFDGPLVVMTSRFSASASEIVAGALQDYGRALVVGDSSTFGKATVQSVLPLAEIMDQNGLRHAYDPGALKVTIRKFYRPSGASTQLRGVAADIVLPSTSDFAEISESALKDPLPWDTVAAAEYERRDRVGPYVAALREQSSRRVAADKGFALMAADIARVRKSLTGKVVSLNEAQRRRELAEAKSQKALWQQESAARAATRPTTYDISLRAAATPGLPAPTVAKVKSEDDKKTDKKQDGKSDDSKRDDDDFSHGPSPAEEVIRREGEKILADYVAMRERETAQERPKKPAVMPPKQHAPSP
jgi:carboxyl-terminal processing protease